jgi:hypothetical protein
VEREDGSMGRRWEMPNGNVVAESREYAGFVHRDGGEPAPYTIPFGGTNLTVAKQWMTMMRNMKLSNGVRAPLFFNKYRIKTTLRQRGKFSWFVYDIEKEGAVETVEDIHRGNALADAFASGVKQSATMDTETASASEVDE